MQVWDGKKFSHSSDTFPINYQKMRKNYLYLFILKIKFNVRNLCYDTKFIKTHFHIHNIIISV